MTLTELRQKVWDAKVTFENKLLETDAHAKNLAGRIDALDMVMRTLDQEIANESLRLERGEKEEGVCSGDCACDAAAPAADTGDSAPAE